VSLVVGLVALVVLGLAHASDSGDLQIGGLR
jgi:hypothetical protein